ncbi:MAG: hypothetical protein ACK5JH_16430 [Anaerocolumna sp.]
MKLGEAIPQYQAYRNQLQNTQNNIYNKLKEAKDKAHNTGSEEWTQKAAELQLSFDEVREEFEQYDDVLNGLKEQWSNAANIEANKALTDPETGFGATMGKIMTTVARMCAGDKVPYSDEKKLMEYDGEMYAKAKQAQMTMAAMKKHQKEYDSLWDKEGGEYDPEGVADDTEAQGELPEIQAEEIQTEEISTEISV